MHAHGGRDSLVYWLEFKDDDEFPTIAFGGIGGGSAFKFGIFRRGGTGAWVTKEKELTVEEAVTIARRNRDQLLGGVRRIRDVPDRGDDEDYRRLQDDLRRIAPDVYDTSWCHKYFSLIVPEKLDDFHTPNYQRFHLIKLLQAPPEGDGRYLCAGRFVAAARDLGLPVSSFGTVLVHLHGRTPHKYWRVGTSQVGRPRSHWPLMRDGRCIAIGWDALGDLKSLELDKASRDRLRRLIHEKYPGNPLHEARMARKVLNFAVGIGEGDVVLACDGASVLGIARVAGGYEYDPSSDFPHRRPVEWLSLLEWKMPTSEGLRAAVLELGGHVDNLIEVERRLLDPPPVIPPVPPPERRSRVIPHLDHIRGRIQDILERKGQVILYGPPGTGKTYWAERTASDLASYGLFGKPFNEISAEERVQVRGGGQILGVVRMCCFHPAYGYEDFIEGYRPELHEGRMTFALRDGLFKRLCRDAEDRPDQNFYLIIDEINRGDIPRIFGELLLIIEPDKRGRSVILPVSQSSFRVPRNVLLIGTMNTADRSIALLDTALRRRFGFIELMPDATLLGDARAAGIPLGPWLEALNRRICDHVGRDARNLQIGHSYLFSEGRPIRDAARFARVVRDEIIPLLEEYCYEDFEALRAILGSGLVDPAKRTIHQELFEEARLADLVSVLLEPCPEVSTSPQATAPDEEAIEEDDEADGVPAEGEEP